MKKCILKWCAAVLVLLLLCPYLTGCMDKKETVLTKYEKNGKTQYSENFHAITKGARDELSRIVLEAYEQSAYMDRYLSEDLGDPESELPFGQSL